MGITISGASTQIPTNVVEVGNEITQNQLNAISASNLPSTGNPMQTSSAMQSYLSANVWPTVNQKTNHPTINWNHPFPAYGNFVTVFSPNTNTWWPWNAANTVIASTQGGTIQNTYDFSFYDGYGSWIPFTGNPDVGVSTTNYVTLGYWDATNMTTFSTQSGQTYYSANGPNYVGNWDSPVGSSQQFYDGMTYNYMYRYVYHDGNGGFYTADNQNNPPY